MTKPHTTFRVPNPREVTTRRRKRVIRESQVRLAYRSETRAS